MTRYIAFCAVLFFALSANGSGRRSSSVPELSTAQQLIRMALGLLNSHRYPEAVSVLDRAVAEARRLKYPPYESWSLNSLASTYFAIGAYRQALDHYIQARDVALNAGLHGQAALALSGLSSLYMHVYDSTSAADAARQAIRLLPKDMNPSDRTAVLLQVGSILMVKNESGDALRAFAQALANPELDERQEAETLDQIGAAFLRSGDLKAAEPALANAYRIRRLTRDPGLPATAFQLGQLHLELENYSLALALVQPIREDPDPVRVPMYVFHFTRARILRGLGRTRESMDEYLLAVDAAAEWRSRGLFADSFRISADVLLARIFDGAIATAVQLYVQSHESQYAVLSWRLNELIHSASLRYTLAGDRAWTRRVPPEYWRTLDRVRLLDSSRFLGYEPSPDLVESAGRLRISLAEMEASAAAKIRRPSPVLHNSSLRGRQSLD